MPDKDKWDKTEIVVKIFASLVLAGIGMVFTILYNQESLINDDIRIVYDSISLIKKTDSIDINSGLNVLFAKKGVVDGLKLLNGSITSDNIDEICQTLKGYKYDKNMFKNILIDLYRTEIYQIAQIDYKCKSEEYHGNGIYSNNGKTISTILPLFESKLITVNIYDIYENEDKTIKLESLDAFKKIIKLDRPRKYLTNYETFDGKIKPNQYAYCLFIDKTHNIDIRTCQILSSNNDVVNVKVIDDSSSIPTGALLFNSKREYIGMKSTANIANTVVTFLRI